MDDRPTPAALRGRIASAARGAVAEYLRNDGYGCCGYYAVAGRFLASAVTGDEFMLQAGSLRVLASPPDGWLVLNARADGLKTGGYHAWFARPGRGSAEPELVDLSASHYARWANSRPGSSIGWTRPTGPPDYVWQDGLSSGWLALVADVELTRAFLASVEREARALSALYRLAIHHFRDMGASLAHAPPRRAA